MINQVLPELEESGTLSQLWAMRQKLQAKYLDLLLNLYEEDFHMVQLPLQRSEVRGVDDLFSFSRLLMRWIARFTND